MGRTKQRIFVRIGPDKVEWVMGTPVDYLDGAMRVNISDSIFKNYKHCLIDVKSGLPIKSGKTIKDLEENVTRVINNVKSYRETIEYEAKCKYFNKLVEEYKIRNNM